MTDDLAVDWSSDAIVRRRETFYAASQSAFVPYRTPLIFSRGERHYLWDESGKKYIDLLGMNVCISVGHAHPRVTAAVQEQIQKLQHCTTMFITRYQLISPRNWSLACRAAAIGSSISPIVAPRRSIWPW